jgi:hypothetical protein
MLRLGICPAQARYAVYTYHEIQPGAVILAVSYSGGCRHSHAVFIGSVVGFVFVSQGRLATTRTITRSKKEKNMAGEGLLGNVRSAR